MGLANPLDVQICELCGLGCAGLWKTSGMAASGPQEFDFIFGHWRVHNRKLRNVADPACEEWVEFDAASHAFPILHGTGHIDRIYVPDPPDGDAFEGFTLRMFDPTAGTWSIWWSSTRAPGRLDPPVVGRFTGNHGVFDCDDIIGGHAVKVRFEWYADALSPTWLQSFSYDSGSTWKLNWEMTLSCDFEAGSQDDAAAILPDQPEAARTD
jgi:hypothetical protein